jgi:hypothetical protein
VYYRRLFIDPDSRHGIGIRGRRTDGIAKSGPLHTSSVKLAKTSKILIIETGMLGGLIGAGYTLPDSTPLKTFLRVSAAVFVIGNILLFRLLRNDPQAGVSPRGAWPHIFRGLAILVFAWLLILVLRRI